MIGLFVLPAAAATLSGTVTNHEGEPVRGATIYAINLRLQAAHTLTDDYGEYAFVLLPSGTYRIAALPAEGDAATPRFLPGVAEYCDGTPLHLTENTHLDQVDLVLPLGLSLSGQLVDVAGTPIPNALLFATAAANGTSTARSAHSTDDGHFSIDGLDPESETDWQVKVSATDFPVQWLGLSYDQESATILAGGTNVGESILLDGIGVDGRVTSEGQPVEAAAVRVYSGSQIRQVITNADGIYNALGLPPGDVITWATAAGLATTYLGDTDRPSTSIAANEESLWLDGVDMDLPPESALTVQLFGAAPRTHGDFSSVTVMAYNDDHTVGRGAAVSSDGLARIEGLHGGSYTVLVYGGDAGHPDDWVRDEDGEPRVFTVPDQSEFGPVDVSLPDATFIEGQVIDDDGMPVVGASVIISDADADESPAATFVIQTDDDGLFSLVGVPTGRWKARALVQPLCPSDPGYVTTYWPNEVDPALWDPVIIGLDDAFLTIGFELPRDEDHDQMGDRWERRTHLDPTRDDSMEDPDADGWPNLSEYRNRTDPHVAEGEWRTVRKCGCATGASGLAGWLLPLIALLRRRDGARARTPAPRV